MDSTAKLAMYYATVPLITIDNFFDGTWHMFSVTRYEKKYLDAYFDLTPIYERLEVTELDLSITEDLSFCNSRRLGDWTPFDGMIDNIRIYNKRLFLSDLRVFSNYPNCPF